MIKLDVQEYCQECPFFEVKVKSNKCDCVTTEGEHILFPGDTTITCKSAERCCWLVENAITLDGKIMPAVKETGHD